jgi:hypothetical protein
VATTLKLVLVNVAVGVPEIIHVEELILTPAGRAGEIVQLVIVAPLDAREVGVIDMATPTAPLVPLAPAKLNVGMLTPVESETEAAAELPAELVAVMLKRVGLKPATGVPEIIQVVVFRLRPVGRLGVTLQFVMAAPLLFNVVGVTDIATPTWPLVPLAPR